MKTICWQHFVANEPRLFVLFEMQNVPYIYTGNVQ